MSLKTVIKSAVFVALLFMIGFTFKSCRDLIKFNAENKELKKQYEAMKKSAQSDKAKLDKIISDQEKKIAKQDKKIAKHQETIADLKKDIGELDDTTADLEKKRKELKDKDAVIANLDRQVEAWKQKFALAQDIIVEKDGIIFSLTAKYESQVKISTAWQEKYNWEYNMRIISERRIEVLEKSFGGLKLSANVSKGIAAILGGILIYSLVSK